MSRSVSNVSRLLSRRPHTWPSVAGWIPFNLPPSQSSGRFLLCERPSLEIRKLQRRPMRAARIASLAARFSPAPSGDNRGKTAGGEP